jgi:hypothetical protein
MYGPSFARTVGNTIYLGENFFNPANRWSYNNVGGDPTSTLIHEYFHLAAVGSKGQQVEEVDLDKAAGGNFGKSMRDNCGPN